ncbi:mannose-P-dolichol utilization defect 1 protein [Ixodes scapularis]|uniref:mannose-P-dolichol utilization defect 1 protein n=1 Tax=Ixodes scapularis TaxID=6945 RepID=UPI00116178AF|nr:mannose-P-dolichol utilization defect 1 protein [Ixodes scapularis]
MTETIKRLLETFFPGKCFEDVLIRQNFTNLECLKIAVSKCLGYGIIVGSTLVKVPQIVKIVQAQSAEGISVTSVLLELIGVTASTAYSYAQRYPFSAWGEGLFLLLETALIAALVLRFRGQSGRAAAFTLSYAALLTLLLSKLVPVSVLWAAQLASVPVIISGKMMQVWSNHRNGHTGQLSAITSGLLFFGALARIFTSVTETGDALMVGTFMIAAVANFCIFAQVLYYWDVTNKRVQDKKK